MVTGPGCMGMVQHCPAHGAQHVLDTADHTGTDIMQHDNTPHVHARTFSLDGFMLLYGMNFVNIWKSTKRGCKYYFF
jgi:hypothetical protein